MPGSTLMYGSILTQRHLEPARLEQRADRGRRDALAERRHHAAGHEDELGLRRLLRHAHPRDGSAHGCLAPAPSWASASSARRARSRSSGVSTSISGAVPSTPRPRWRCRARARAAARAARAARAATAAAPPGAAGRRADRRTGRCAASPGLARPRARRRGRAARGCARSRAPVPPPSLTTFTTCGERHSASSASGVASVAIGSVGSAAMRAASASTIARIEQRQIALHVHDDVGVEPVGDLGQAIRPARMVRPRIMTSTPSTRHGGADALVVGRDDHARDAARAARPLGDVADHRPPGDRRERLPRQPGRAIARGNDGDGHRGHKRKTVAQSRKPGRGVDLLGQVAAGVRRISGTGYGARL